MKVYAFIGIGGFLGAILRFIIENIHVAYYKESLPLNTLLINLSGSFVLALFLTVTLEIGKFSANKRSGVSIGFLGAFTTFSTLCKESVKLFENDQYYLAVVYIFSTIILGLSVTYLGILLAKKIVLKFIKNGEEVV